MKLVDELFTCTLAVPHTGEVNPSGTVIFRSTVVSSEPLNGTVCSNGARRNTFCVLPGT